MLNKLKRHWRKEAAIAALLAYAFGFWIWRSYSFTTGYNDCSNASAHQNNHDCTPYNVYLVTLRKIEEVASDTSFWNALITLFAVVVTAIATVYIAKFTIVLSNIGKQQALDNRITEQAYVFPLAPQSQFLMDENQTILGLRLWVPWRNSGGTPAVPVNSLVGTTWVQNEADFVFGAVVQEGQHQPFVLGPSADIPSGVVDITGQHLTNILVHHQGYLFFWGWARFKDVFPDSPWHVVEFCFRVTIEGQLGPPPFTGRVGFAFYGEHNRYYDEA